MKNKRRACLRFEFFSKDSDNAQVARKLISVIRMARLLGLPLRSSNFSIEFQDTTGEWVQYKLG